MGSMSHRNRRLIISLLLLMISSATHVRFTAQGLRISKLIERGWEENEGTQRRVMIGSRPPICQRKCESCGHCEAIQVPVSPLTRRRNYSLSKFTAPPIVEVYSRYDDVTNYKPMCWKCKCGDYIFDP